MLRKSIAVSLVLASALVLAGANKTSAQDLVLYDAFGVQHNIYLFSSLPALGNGGPTLLGIMTATPNSFGLFQYQPDWNAVQLKVFEDGFYWGYSYEGHLAGTTFDVGWGNNSPFGSTTTLSTIPTSTSSPSPNAK